MARFFIDMVGTDYCHIASEYLKYCSCYPCGLGLTAAPNSSVAVRYFHFNSIQEYHALTTPESRTVWDNAISSGKTPNVPFIADNKKRIGDTLFRIMSDTGTYPMGFPNTDGRITISVPPEAFDCLSPEEIPLARAIIAAGAFTRKRQQPLSLSERLSKATAASKELHTSALNRKTKSIEKSI